MEAVVEAVVVAEAVGGIGEDEAVVMAAVKANGN